MFRGGGDGSRILGILCCGIGSRNPDRGHFSGGGSAVSGGVFADCVRLCLLPALERSMAMNIVVWKSPKCLRGILRKLFRVRS